MFLSPIASLIPRCATAGALLYVGVLMMGNVTNIDWKDPAAAVPAFLTISMMSFAYSISYGIAAGFISYTVIKLCTGKIKDISPVTAILTLVFLFTFLFTIDLKTGYARRILRRAFFFVSYFWQKRR